MPQPQSPPPSLKSESRLLVRLQPARLSCDRPVVAPPAPGPWPQGQLRETALRGCKTLLICEVKRILRLTSSFYPSLVLGSLFSIPTGSRFRWIPTGLSQRPSWETSPSSAAPAPDEAASIYLPRHSVQFFQKCFQMIDALIDAMSFLFREPSTMHEAQCGIVGFPRILDLIAPCSRTGR